MKAVKKWSLLAIFIIYLLALTKLIVFKYFTLSDIIEGLISFNFEHEIFWRSHNFIPIATLYHYLFESEINLSIRIKNIAGNILAFVPLGLLLPIIFKSCKSFHKVALIAFSLSLTFELTQLLLKIGSFDVDDILLNLLGSVLGTSFLLIFQFLKSYRR